QDRRAVVVLAREQERGSLTGEVLSQDRRVRVDLGLEVRVGRFAQQLDCGLEILGARDEALPGLDLGTEAVRLAEDPLGGPLVVPEAMFAGQRVELRDALCLRLEVKGAPRSTGSARPGRGWRTRPLVPALEILEQDRAQLDEPQRGLAPGDDGVHTGAIAVVRTHATVAITVEGRRITAVPAIALARDEIDERGILGLLQRTPSICSAGHERGGGWETCREDASGPGSAGWPSIGGQPSSAKGVVRSGRDLGSPVSPRATPRRRNRRRGRPARGRWRPTDGGRRAPAGSSGSVSRTP